MAGNRAAPPVKLAYANAVPPGQPVSLRPHRLARADRSAPLKRVDVNAPHESRATDSRCPAGRGFELSGERTQDMPAHDSNRTVAPNNRLPQHL